MKKLLITGFQPFDGESVNPALEVAKGLQGKTINGYEVIAREIPVVRFEALKAVQAAIEELQPNAVITIDQPIDEPVVTGGPVAYWATLPIKKMVANVKAQGIPASVSNSAGTYVCNHLLYGLLHYLTTQGKTAIPAGFIHIPYLPEQMAVRSGKDAQVATMSLDTLLKGFEAMIAALD